jgi:hypothetical protein
LPVEKKDSFFKSSLKDLGTWLVQNILVPAAKNMINDAVSGSTARLLYGEGVKPSSRIQGKTNYNSISTSNTYRQTYREVTARQNSYENIILDKLSDAEMVLDSMIGLCDTWKACSVADLYDLVGIPTKYTDNAWGWENLDRASVKQVRAGYLLDLPEPKPIESR